MARPRQKKKQRSSRSAVRTGQAGRTKAGKKKVNFLGNEVIAKNWDHKLTLAQNYDRLGLSVRLNNRTGGVEKHRLVDHDSDDDIAGAGQIKRTRNSAPDSLHIASSRIGQIVPSEVEVERDPETGAILRIVGEDGNNNSTVSLTNPLNDPLVALDEDEEDGTIALSETGRLRNRNEIVRQLEAQAVAESESMALKKKPRQQSAREEEWIEALVDKHGENYAAMVRDKKLNPRQQSEGDIKKRIKKWKAAHG